jgi:hypothetical protein
MNSKLSYAASRSPKPFSDSVVRRSATLVWMLCGLGLALSPLSDFLSVRASQNGNEAPFSLLLRGGMVAGLLVALLLRGRVREFSARMAFLAITAIVVSSFAYAWGEMSGGELGKQTIFILKVFSFFVCYSAFSGMDDTQLEKLEPLIKAVLMTYALAIIAGAALSIEMFRSYQADTQIRSGYKGIIYAQNEASALLIVGLAYAYTSVLKSGWRVFNMALAGSVMVASMLLGTKGAAVGAVGVTFAYLYARYGVLKATSRALLVVALLAVMAISAYLTMPSVKQAADLTFRYFTYHHDHANGNGALTVLLSGRNVKFANVWGELAQQNYVPLLTGGYPVVRYQVEIDAPDLALALGLPVFVLYIWAFASRFLYRGRARLVRFGRFFFIVLMAVACSAGHVLVSALISPYLAVIAVMVARCAALRKVTSVAGQDHD